MRRARRYRNTPCRKNRANRSRGCLPSSTKARWRWKLRLCSWLSHLFPISHFIVEDIKARTMGKRRWDLSFSPLEVGKKWFYEQLGTIAVVSKAQGWETKQLRDALGLKKIGNKKTAVFAAHCVDSWVLANSVTGGHRRQFHRLQLQKKGRRFSYGGTRSFGFKRGSVVKHPKWGICYIGGTSKDRLSLHSLDTGKRVSRTAKPFDCQFLTYNTWRQGLSPV